ncbi:Uma2 family endonuclease [Anoxybacillus tepidamans]|uniref:Uma2 family endonuclease n=1 Tax=Anoxybacteroides tepidamans TaxID=265948 RepID=A0A7W8INS8_9BACL|nr:Uma2 family endonuclease [Anoxybacillus tepidamans]MBB5323266.1 Uma2 family endonuclease [Anoxybacillus tepidamans]
MSEREEKRLYTLAEFFAFVGEKRMELYEGVPVLMAPASYEHEGVVANLIGEIKPALKGSSCLVFGSNLQVVFLFQDEQKGKENVTVLPDISIVCDKEKLRNKRCYGAPDVIVEVLSPSTARNDRLLKRHYYEKAGVKEYWIVDYQNQTIEKYVLYSGSLRLEEMYDRENSSFVSTVLPNIAFFTHDIFSFLM